METGGDGADGTGKQRGTGIAQPKEPDASVTLDQLPRVLIYQKGMIPAGTAALEFTNNGILHSTPTSPRAHTLPNLPEHGALAKSEWARVVTREIRELIAREWRHMLGQRERRDSG